MGLFDGFLNMAKAGVQDIKDGSDKVDHSGATTYVVGNSALVTGTKEQLAANKAGWQEAGKGIAETVGGVMGMAAVLMNPVTAAMTAWDAFGPKDNKAKADVHTAGNLAADANYQRTEQTHNAAMAVVQGGEDTKRAAHNAMMAQLHGLHAEGALAALMNSPHMKMHPEHLKLGQERAGHGGTAPASVGGPTV